jgi:nitrate reductase (NAD(P)H)
VFYSVQPTGQHVFVRLRRKVPKHKTNADGSSVEFESTEVFEGELVQRAYTPVSSQKAKGHIDLLIKLYLANDTWRDGGKMTTGFHELDVGDHVEFKGPLGSFTYLADGNCRWRNIDRKVKKFGMICAGSGITPILQVLRGIIEGDDGQGDGDRETEMWCIDSNRREEDIRKWS